MIKLIVYMTFIFLIFNQCKNCEIDQKALRLYNDNLEKYEKWNFFDTLNRDSMVYLGNKFGNLTGHKPQFIFGFTPTYFPNEKSEDIEKWKSWVNKNKCIISYKELQQTMRFPTTKDMR